MHILTIKVPLNHIFPATNVPERVEVPNKTTQLPNQNKRGRSTDTKDKASCKLPRKQRNPSSKIVNANQRQTERNLRPKDTIHPVDTQHRHPSSTVHTNTDAGTSEHPESIAMGNHDESKRVDEISINYIDSGESFDRNTRIVNTSPQRLPITFTMIQIPRP